MAQVTITDTSTGGGDGDDFDITHTVGAGNIIFVGVLLETTGNGVNTVTWNGSESLSEFTVFSPGTGKMKIEVWLLETPTVGAATLNVLLDTPGKVGIIVVSANADDITPLSNIDTDENSSSSTGSVSVTQAANDLAFCFAGHNEDTAFSIGGGETEHEDLSSGAGGFRMWAASQDGTGATTLSWSQSASKENSTVGFLIGERLTRRIFIT